MLLAAGLVREGPKAGLFRSFKKCPVVFAPHTVYAQGVTVLWSADMESNGSRVPTSGSGIILLAVMPAVQVVACIAVEQLRLDHLLTTITPPAASTLQC
jgi:hypothetical protein